ncbi:type III-A CRISPR-associated protein Cas10/Csm1 [Thioflexithrix psekupsensis]|uniref:GGDEF domain-containing protein n=1 Tax=Thioflexithrix psekupsensis TaxID=1570016 RepID=A0A251X841_9GAMM|nr:hypothetical protein [Thioflexithrix psekupsensis]OUD14219.1 hypothetical protein TPSD3_07770 [Thioflexithrix psekupsensis]
MQFCKKRKLNKYSVKIDEKRLFLLSQDELTHFLKESRSESSLFERLNDFDCFKHHTEKNIYKTRLLGRWDKKKKKESRDWHFDQFATHADGIKRMGVLRMDVDNLGSIFSLGLGKNPSISQRASLSRQLNIFFSGYLNSLLEKYNKVQIIYSGGDDLFLIGSWDRLPYIADEIRRKFLHYCAHNENFSLSGGMVVVEGNYPMALSAVQAGEAEEAAKSLLRYKNGEKQTDKTKNSFCMLDIAIPWEIYQDVVEFRELIVSVIEGMENNKAIIDRLRKVVLAMGEYERLYLQKNKDNSTLHQLMQWQQWRWQLVYNLSRLKRSCSDNVKADISKIEEMLSKNGWEMQLPVNQWLELPVRWAEFLTRKE